MRVLRVDVAQHRAELRASTRDAHRRACDVDRVGAKSGISSGCRDRPPFACGFAPMRASPVGASAASVGIRRPLASNSSSGSVAPHPRFEHRELLGFVAHVGERHLVRAERAFDRDAVDLLRAGPALRACAARSRASAAVRDTPLVRASVWIARMCVEAGIERRGERLMHAHRLVAFDEVHVVAVARRAGSRSPRRSRDRAPSAREIL